MSYPHKIKNLLRKAYYQAQKARYPKFWKLKTDANGMLQPGVYKRMYNLVCKLPDLDMIEVGGASGAGSIAIALAIKESGKKSKLIVIEKCEGGSRIKTGDHQDNLDLLRKNFQKFGVEDNIVLFPHEVTFQNGEKVTSLIKTPKITALIHDADGRIDRDFYLFWPMLKPGGLIIVDDYANQGKYLQISDRHPTGGMKCLLTYRLLNQIREWGLFKTTYKKGKTVFGYKPHNADFSKFDLQITEKIVKEVELERVRYLQNNLENIGT